MKSLLVTALMIAGGLTGLVLAADSRPPINPQAREYSERDLPDFRNFFFLRSAAAITAREVEDRFGPPPRYSQLRHNDEPEDVTRDHSWWYYPLGKDSRVGVAIDLGMVEGANYFYLDEKGKRQNETLRKPSR